MITILQGDVIEQLRTLPNESVHCCVTSPPYWGLRDYSTNGQLGLEKTPEEYVAKMVAVFREVRRVLRKDGTLWLNMGDCYASQGGPLKDGGGINDILGGKKETQDYNRSRSAPDGLKPKDLCGVPWRVAFALQTDGWWLRSDIIWAKPNPMPESVTDRPTKAHEYLFLLTKSANYFYDAEAIKERGIVEEGTRRTIGKPKEGGLTRAASSGTKASGNEAAGFCFVNGNRNKRSVWTVATAPYPEAHFATYPPDLIKPCILAGTSAKGCCAKCGSPWERVVNVSYSNWAAGNNNGRRKGEIPKERMTFASGKRCDKDTKTLGWRSGCQHLQGNYDTIPCTILDPFAGSGTTGAVALELGRKAVLIELNPKYVELIERRCSVTMGLPLAV